VPVSVRVPLLGEKLLTTPNPGVDKDREMFEELGLEGRPPHYEQQISGATVSIPVQADPMIIKSSKCSQKM
jgi:hypothetical protein